MTKKVGLALGSGSAKGIAHIGVIQVLEEYGVPVDVVAGSSAGAIIGAIYAVGTDLNMLGKYFEAISGRDYMDVTLPRSGKGGLVRGDRMEELIRVFTHDKTFRETRIPFICMAVDIENGELVAFSDTDKKLHECVRASMSIPGIFMPVRIDGRLYVDGGVLERVPCIPLREAGADVVIGVDVGNRGEPKYIETPTLRSMYERTLDVVTWFITRQRQEAADILLCPQVIGIMKGFSTKNTQEAIAEGRRVAEEAMPQILALLEKNEIPLKKPARLRSPDRGADMEN